MSRILLIGTASQCRIIGRRLMRILGYTPGEYYGCFERIVLSARRLDWNGKKSAIKAEYAKKILCAQKSRRIILLGKRTAAMIGLYNTPYLSWIPICSDNSRTLYMAVIPCPLEAHYWWNRASNMAAMKTFLLDAIHSTRQEVASYHEVDISNLFADEDSVDDELAELMTEPPMGVRVFPRMISRMLRQLYL